MSMVLYASETPNRIGIRQINVPSTAGAAYLEAICGSCYWELYKEEGSTGDWACRGCFRRDFPREIYSNMMAIGIHMPEVSMKIWISAWTGLSVRDFEYKVEFE